MTGQRLSAFFPFSSSFAFVRNAHVEGAGKDHPGIPWVQQGDTVWGSKQGEDVIPDIVVYWKTMPKVYYSTEAKIGAALNIHCLESEMRPRVLVVTGLRRTFWWRAVV